MNTNELPPHYRYEVTDLSEDGHVRDFRLNVTEFAAVRETPCGYWIQRCPGWNQGRLRWVSKTSCKRFAYPTKKDALGNYIRRTGRHIQWGQYRLEKATAGLALAVALREGTV